MENKKRAFTRTKVGFMNQNQYGQLWSQPLDASALDALSKVEPGCKFVVDTYDAKDGSGKVYVLNLIPASEIQASEAAWKARKKTESPTVDI